VRPEPPQDRLIVADEILNSMTISFRHARQGRVGADLSAVAPRAKAEGATRLSIHDGGSISAPRIEENDMLKDDRFLEEGEQKPITVAIADADTNAVVDAVAPSMN
jgi:hypothetical protein